jgi:hypothetical protein
MTGISGAPLLPLDAQVRQDEYCYQGVFSAVLFLIRSLERLFVSLLKPFTS